MKRITRMSVALLAALVLVGGTALSSSASPVQATPVASSYSGQIGAFVVPTGYIGGNYWAWTQYSYFGKWVPGVKVRFSWSHMWYIEDHMGSATAISASMCGLLVFSFPAASACAAYVGYLGGYKIRDKVKRSLANKKCIEMRFALPPYLPWYGHRMTEVTCTR